MAYKVNMIGGAHPTLVDYACGKCGAVTEDVFFASRLAVTTTIACACGHAAEKIISQRRNFIHPSKSSMYGKYEEGLGCVVQDYGHKQQLMREMGVIEGADPGGGSRNHWRPQPKAPEASNTVWVDDPRSLNE